MIDLKDFYGQDDDPGKRIVNKVIHYSTKYKSSSELGIKL